MKLYNNWCHVTYIWNVDVSFKAYNMMNVSDHKLDNRLMHQLAIHKVYINLL